MSVGYRRGDDMLKKSCFVCLISLGLVACSLSGSQYKYRAESKNLTTGKIFVGKGFTEQEAIQAANFKCSGKAYGWHCMSLSEPHK